MTDFLMPRSPTRLWKVQFVDRARLLVVAQDVARRVTIQPVGTESIWVTESADPRRFARMDLPEMVQVSSSQPLQVSLATGQLLIARTNGNLVPVLVAIEYLWEPDPDVAVATRDLYERAQPLDAYTESADEAWTLTDDPVAAATPEMPPRRSTVLKSARAT